MTASIATAGSPAAAAPHATGETNLARLLAGFAPALAPRPRAIRTQAHAAPLPPCTILWFREDEAASVIVDVDPLDAGVSEAGAGADEPHWAHIVLRIHSSLEAVGMMAAISAALAARGIPCNVVSAYFHDHLFVPWARREDALDALRALSQAHASPRNTAGDAA